MEDVFKLTKVRLRVKQSGAQFSKPMTPEAYFGNPAGKAGRTLVALRFDQW